MTCRKNLLQIEFALILCTVLTFCFAVKYEIVVEDGVYKPCRDYPDDFLTKYLTLPENFTNLPDDRLYIKGDYVMKCDFKSQEYPFFLEIYKKGRGGSWEKTVYGFKRNDFCKSLFDPSEIWFFYTNIVPEEQRVCPLFNGEKFDIDVTIEQRLDLPSPTMEGDYLVHLEVGSRARKDDFYFCSEMFISLYRI